MYRIKNFTEVLKTVMRCHKGGCRAFTLAEVLITLGVIGVVAVITMPTLIQNYKKQVTVTQLKKAYSEISQALKLAEVEHGMMETWDFSLNNGKTQDENSTDFANNYLFPYIKTLKICQIGESTCYQTVPSYAITAISPNGSSYWTWTDKKRVGAWVYVDIDGSNKGKNEKGKDIFGIKIVYNAGNDASDNPVKKGFYLNGLQYVQMLTRDELKENSDFCGALIMLDGWKISDDNPCW